MGFANLGKDSFNHNRKMRNNRTSVKDHPYFGKGERHSALNPFDRELEDWQEQKRARTARMRRLIFGLILSLMVLVAILVAAAIL